MKTKIVETNETELKKMLAEKRTVLSNFKFGATGSKMKDVKSARTTRRQIAQILTKLGALKKTK